MKKKYLIWVPIVIAGVFLLRFFGVSNAMPDDEQRQMIINGEMDLTYELFGAEGDGVTNDYEAIKNAHDFANEILLKEDVMITVKAESGKTYYISTMDEPIDVITNVDFNDATFIIDDYVDDNNDSVNDINTVNAVFNITSPMAISSSEYIDVASSLPDDFELTSDFSNDCEEDIYSIVVNSEAYTTNNNVSKYLEDARYWGIAIENSNLQYIRTGKNATQGDYQTEIIVYDTHKKFIVGNMDWEYDDIISFKVFPISNVTQTIKGGTFITKTNNVVYSSREINKYSNRNIYVNYTGNVSLENIKHKVDENSHEYTSEYQSKNGNLYFGFIKLFNTAEVSINNVDLMPKTYTNIYLDGTETASGNGTYDLTINNSMNVYLDDVSYYCDGDADDSCYTDNMLDDSKWGIMNSNYVKNLIITNSKLNRVDAHKGVTNLFIQNSVIGNKGITLIGKGIMYVDNVVFDGSTSMINLRDDYGSTFDGSITMKNVTYKVGNASYPNIIYSDNKQNHDYGYSTYFPSLYIDGINIDTSNCNDLVYVSAIRLTQNILSTTDFDNEAALYDIKDSISIKNVTISEGSSIKLFPDDFSLDEGNLKYTSYSRPNGVTIMVALDLDEKIFVHNAVTSIAENKFYIARSPLESSINATYIDYYKSLFEHVKLFDGTMVYKFSKPILEYIDDIVSVSYIKDTNDNLTARYEAANVKSLLSYNSTKKAMAWLEDAEKSGKYNLYVGSSEDIYLYEGTEIFSGFTELESVDFTNLIFNNVTDVSYMFSGCEKLVNVDFSKIIENDLLLSGKGMLDGANMIISPNLNKPVFEILKPDGLDAKLALLMYGEPVYDKNGDIKLTGNIVTGDYLTNTNGDEGEVFYFVVGNDLTGDGIVNIADVARLYAHVRGTNLFPNVAFEIAGDTVKDGNVLINDVAKLYSDVRGNRG